ncbi:alpha/beta fold hydrolase [Gordonia sp. PKS22-38]|uniref:Alpha/beta fold hydrolase n=1 Tax=Gordonia prachuapensis TaxID=3115651 RepID=A0ABU7MTN1_9ACTN|nr:alpha/beta fold hydrolase [Gordonia sp. PKS22-38]
MPDSDTADGDSSEHDGADGYTDQAVTVDGIRLYTRRRQGDSPVPLLLIHGLGGSMDSWEPLLAQMPGRDVIMIDSPGMGRSEVPRRPLPMHGIADKLAGALRALEVSRVDVLGYSHGGAVAQEFAKRHSDRLRRLTLVATVAGLPWVPPRLSAQRALLSTRRYHSREAAAADVPLLAGGRTASDETVLAEILADREAHPPSTTGYRYLQLAVLGWSSHPWLHRLQCRTLVLQGDDDPVVRTINGRFLAGRIRHARLELLPGAGHMMMFDEPDRVGPIIEQFLTDE